MVVTFKNVGQGDSIILEWEIAPKNKRIAIIDCTLDDSKGNPVLQHIKASKCQEIDYLILSHPHTDHYSGMIELIQYCVGNGIIIHHIGHTSRETPDFLKMASISKIATNEIQKLSKLFRECRDKRDSFLGSLCVGESDEINLRGGYKLKVLAPTGKHMDNYASKVDFEADYEVDGNTHYANWLSTVLVLEKENDSRFCLFTADAPKPVLKELGIKVINVSFKGRALVLGQIPHHGAKLNHVNAFWNNMPRTTGSKAVVSVGLNHYGHPNKDVIDTIVKYNYTVYSTQGSKISLPTHVSNALISLNAISTVTGGTGPAPCDQVFTPFL